MTNTHWCARCKYSFDATIPAECPMCGTRDVEKAQHPNDHDDDEEDDGDG